MLKDVAGGAIMIWFVIADQNTPCFPPSICVRAPKEESCWCTRIGDLQYFASVGFILHGAVVTEKVIAVTSRAAPSVSGEQSRKKGTWSASVVTSSETHHWGLVDETLSKEEGPSKGACGPATDLFQLKIHPKWMCYCAFSAPPK